MNIPDWLYHWLWHGVRGAVLAGGAAATASVQATGEWPTKVAWLIIGISTLVGFINGCDSYQTDPH